MRTVLYIDDDPAHLELIQTLLEKRLGVMVDVVSTSQGAEQRLNSYCYDLVISDVSLVGELGTTIAEKVLERDPQQPVLILTAYDGEKIEEEVKRLGVPCINKVTAASNIEQFLSDVQALVEKRPCVRRDRRQNNQHTHNRRVSDKPLQITSPYVAAARASLQK